MPAAAERAGIDQWLLGVDAYPDFTTVRCPVILLAIAPPRLHILRVAEAHLHSHWILRAPWCLAQLAGAPDGNVAIVHTDIEGSTDLWARNTAMMQSCVAMHDAVLRRLLAKHQGHEVTTEGDAFVVAFHTPAMAVAWCFEVQVRTLTAGCRSIFRCVAALASSSKALECLC